MKDSVRELSDYPPPIAKYICECASCGVQFYGPKRCVACKRCGALSTLEAVRAALPVLKAIAEKAQLPAAASKAQEMIEWCNPFFTPKVTNHE